MIIIRLLEWICYYLLRPLIGGRSYYTHVSIWMNRLKGVQIGEGCRIYNCSFGSEPYLITIGNHVSVTNDVQFITHDGAVWIFRDTNPGIDLVGRIIVGNNVFIGMKSVILPGVTIGDNVIIGAGSIVASSVPSGLVAAGNPAKTVCTVEEYLEKNRSNFVLTKGMSSTRKQEEILKHMRFIKK